MKEDIYCAAVVAVLGGHWVELCQQQPEWELHERPAKFPKAPMGTAVSFSCFVCIRSVGTNLTRYSKTTTQENPRNSSAELCFTLACEHGQMGRESQRGGMKGSSQSCGHHGFVATGHLLSLVTSHVRETLRTEGRKTYIQFLFTLQRTPCLQILHSFMHLQHHCLQWVCRN